MLAAYGGATYDIWNGAQGTLHEANKARKGNQWWRIGSNRHEVHRIKIYSLLCNMV